MASVEWLLDQGGHFLRLGVMGIKLTRLKGERFENVGLKPTLKRRMHTALCIARHSRENGIQTFIYWTPASEGMTLPSLRLKASGFHHPGKGH
jgi:hypothetical protein